MQRSRLALVPPWTSRALRPSRAVWLALGLVVGACGGGGPLEPGGSGGSGGSGGGGDFVPGLDERPQVEACVPVADPPSLLSEHPCFGGAPPRPSEELVPYDVRTPLWSDAALKERFLAIPAPARATVSATGDWDLPVGSVLVKEFRWGATPLETRIISRADADTWLAFTYVWDSEGLDAARVDDGTVLDVEGETWTVPSQQDCFACHTEAAGRSLGVESQQLSGEVLYPTGRTADQLRTLAAIGLVDPDDVVDEAGDPLHPPLARLDDEGGSLEARARSYLHANCAHCHRPGGPGGGSFDLRVQLSLAGTNTCDVLPDGEDPTAGGDGRIIAPGEPERSVLYLRMTSTDPLLRMPPLGTAVVDEDAAAVIEAWIASLASCP